MEIYRNEGCWYCHTQYVRETTVDKQLGRPRDPADYAGRSPAMLGYERIGGDLPGGLAGDRAVTAKSLRESHSFAYLSSADLRALVAYLFSLR
jgi:cbb3-type cytochrome oxidase cytochrome c subunit